MENGQRRTFSIVNSPLATGGTDWLVHQCERGTRFECRGERLQARSGFALVGEPPVPPGVGNE